MESQDLPPLPAAVEVAAYRIVQEALTNVVRHSGAHTCLVDLRLGETNYGEALFVGVTDDGCGPHIPWSEGVGLHSMRTRAAELCGTCMIEARLGAERGTHVAAVLPLVCPEIREGEIQKV